MMQSPPDNDNNSAWRGQARVARYLTVLAVTIGLVVAVAGPLGFWWLSEESEAKETNITARLYAAFLTQAITTDGGNWRSTVLGLIDAPLTDSDLPERRAILDLEHREVTSSGPALARPWVMQSIPLTSQNGVVGEMVVTRSMRPILLQTGVVAVLSLAIGLAIFLTLRVLPLRALRRTIAALHHHEAQARRQAEEQLQTILDHSIEGVIAYLPAGEVISANQAALRMLDYAEEDIRKRNVVSMIERSREPTPGFALPLGRMEAKAIRRDGSSFPVEVGISEVVVGGDSQRIAIVRDLSERKEHEDRLSQMANFDDLTGLPNRSLFRNRLENAMARTRRTHRPCALMFIDLDRFKHINDSLGHDVGDQLLVAVSRALSNCVRETDLLAIDRGAEHLQSVFRLGGDEFTVLLEDLVNESHAMTVAERILKLATQPFVLTQHELYVSVSVGITTFDDTSNAGLDDLVKQADMAMYRAKELGRDTYCFFDQALNRNAVERHQLEGQLRRALERNEFLLHYQPKVDVHTGKVFGVEALLRWQPADGPMIGPDKFIPILEESGLIVSVGAWAIRASCAQMMAWQANGMPPISLAVNLSGRQFRQKDLIQHIAEVLKTTGFEPTLLEIELTESMLISDSDAVLRILRQLGNMGVKIAIDDFGTGHSSLSYLKRFNVDTLKIDRAFVRDTPHDPDDCAISRAVIALGHGLSLKVVAEGVETLEQLEFLRQQGCDLVQGYLVSRPLDAQAFERWMAAYNPTRLASSSSVESPRAL